MDIKQKLKSRLNELGLGSLYEAIFEKLLAGIEPDEAILAVLKKYGYTVDPDADESCVEEWLASELHDLKLLRLLPRTDTERVADYRKTIVKYCDSWEIDLNLNASPENIVHAFAAGMHNRFAKVKVREYLNKIEEICEDFGGEDRVISRLHSIGPSKQLEYMVKLIEQDNEWWDEDDEEEDGFLEVPNPQTGESWYLLIGESPSVVKAKILELTSKTAHIQQDPYKEGQRWLRSHIHFLEKVESE